MPLFLPHFNLQTLNTLAVPAIAQFYVSITNDDELRDALKFARTENLPVMILGGGSNIVLRADFPGVVIQLRSQGLELVGETDEWVWLKVAAGENWHGLVEYTLAQGFYGLENLSLIPGSVGAAPIQNIGAYGVELKDVFAELTAIEITSGLSITFTPESCQFGYRDSVFKNVLKDKYVITSVTFVLRKQAQLNLTYPALRAATESFSADELTPETLSEAVIAIRQSKLPDPKIIPNVGSFFKNPVIARAHFENLLTQYPTLVAYPVDEQQVKLAAGWLIDQAGWRGREAHGALVHAQQALVLTNPQKLSGAAVLALAKDIQNAVREKFAVDLEMEPRVYPD